MQSVKSKLDSILKDRGMSHTDVWKGIGWTESGYFKMFRNETMDVRTLLAIAEFLALPAATLLPDAHRGEVLQRKPEGRPYVEDRLEQLEREVRGMRQELKRKH